MRPMKTLKYAVPELVSPAGDWPSLQSAISAGADAVYFGLKELNMRLAADNFDSLEMGKIISLLHKNNKKGYLAINTIVYEKEIPKVRKILSRAQESGVDAVIAWDMGVVSLAREFGVPVHLSTQASVANFESLRFFSRLGIKRIVVARECSLADIKDIIAKIKKQKLDCQVEAFIHGAMCVSVSGRCLLSQYTFRKSANRGECFQPCRQEYLIKEAAGPNEYIVGKGYLLSPKDLCSIDFIDKIIASGVSALKIEGRMRSPEYTQVVTSVYRKAIDAFFKNELSLALKKALRKELETVFNRGFDSGFYFGEPSGEESLLGAHGYEKIFLGEVTNFYNRISVAEVILRNRSVSEGDELLVFGKSTASFFLPVLELQIKHRKVKLAHKGDLVGIKTDRPVKPKDKVFLWRKRKG